MRWDKQRISRRAQPSIFDQAQRQAQEGINISYANAPSEWKKICRETLVELCTSKSEFTTDELWERLADKGIHTGEPRALGAIIQGAHRSGMIKKTGHYLPSHRRHNAPIPIWQSLIYKGAV